MKIISKLYISEYSKSPLYKYRCNCHEKIYFFDHTNSKNFNIPKRGRFGMPLYILSSPQRHIVSFDIYSITNLMSVDIMFDQNRKMVKLHKNFRSPIKTEIIEF